LTNKFAVDKLPEDVDIVFALAAVNGTSRFYSQPFYVLYNSTQSTINIIAKYAKLATILYSSSSEVYGCGVGMGLVKVPTAEDAPVIFSEISNPRWSYGSAKALGEFALHAAAREFNARGVIIRYHNVYGPDMGSDHFVPDFIDRALARDFKVYGPEQTRSFIYIDDAISATISAVSKASSSIPCFHIGTDEEITILDASKLILRLLGSEYEEVELVSAPAGSVSRRCPDVRKAKEELMWKPIVSLEQGIKEFLKWRIGKM
jgi:nucleoside-diphosphate-sugar epimerase